MVSTSPYRPPSDGERSNLKVEVSLSARALNGLKDMKNYLGLERLNQVIRKALVVLQRLIDAERQGKQLCLCDPKTGELEVITLKKISS